MSLAVPLACRRCGAAVPTDAPVCGQCKLALDSVSRQELVLVLRSLARSGGSREWMLSGHELVLGRTGVVDVAIPHDSISRRHARISRASQGFLIEDLGSKNGTFVG